MSYGGDTGWVVGYNSLRAQDQANWVARMRGWKRFGKMGLWGEEGWVGGWVGVDEVLNLIYMSKNES